RISLFKNINKMCDEYCGNRNDAINIWRLLYKRDEYRYYWQIEDFVSLLEKMSEKKIWEIIFELDNVDYRDYDRPDTVDVENYFLYRTEKNTYKYEKKVYEMSQFSGLIPFCYSMISNNNGYEDLYYRLINLLIKGIEKAGFKCLSFASVIYSFIFNYDLKKKSELIIKFKNSFPIPDDLYINFDRIDSLKTYLSYSKNDAIDNYLFKILDCKKQFSIEEYDEKYHSLVSPITVRILSEIPLSFIDLSKMWFMFGSGGSLCTPALDCKKDTLLDFKLICHYLIDDNISEDNRFYSLDNKYNGLIPFCFYKKYKWVSEILIETIFKTIFKNELRIAMGEINNDSMYNNYAVLKKKIYSFIDFVKDDDLLDLKKRLIEKEERRNILK
ncbi:MAG: hypothetical protein K6E24_02645, partial [bacterium]|nr:hypothetical protein [bacterium]